MGWTNADVLIEEEPTYGIWRRDELERPPRKPVATQHGRRFVSDPCSCSPFKASGHNGRHRRVKVR